MKALQQQEVSIKGKVFRSDTNQLLSNVEVDLLDEEQINRSPKNMATVTNVSGEYSFENVKPGKYTIVVSMKYEKEKDLPCGKEVDRFINDRIGVTSWRDKELFLQHGVTPKFSVSAGNQIIKNFDFSCKRRVTRRK